MEGVWIRCCSCFQEFPGDEGVDPANPLEETCPDCLSRMPVEISFVPPYTCSEEYRFEEIRSLPDELLLARFRDAYLRMLEGDLARIHRDGTVSSVQTSNDLASAGNELGRRGFSLFQLRRLLATVQ